MSAVEFENAHGACCSMNLILKCETEAIEVWGPIANFVPCNYLKLTWYIKWRPSLQERPAMLGSHLSNRNPTLGSRVNNALSFTNNIFSPSISHITRSPSLQSEVTDNIFMTTKERSTSIWQVVFRQWAWVTATPDLMPYSQIKFKSFCTSPLSTYMSTTVSTANSCAHKWEKEWRCPISATRAAKPMISPICLLDCTLAANTSTHSIKPTTVS